MDRDKLKKYLKQKGFKDINHDDVFDNDYSCVHIDTDGNPGIRISYGYNEDGWYHIDNPTMDQIVAIIELFSAATYTESTAYNIIKNYGELILDDFKKYLSETKE
jgi:hypothetical protein